MQKPLLLAAHKAREAAYAPYSHFKVGAAVATGSGQIFHGCNIENAAYGLCNCAERTALFAAIAAGVKPEDFTAIAVVAEGRTPVSPCGACRQVMYELLAPQTPVWLGNLNGDVRVTTVAALLPDAFHEFAGQASSQKS